MISELMNSNVEIICEKDRVRPEKSEVQRLFGDNSLLKSLTDWKPEYGELDGFKKGLQITIDWFIQPGNLIFYKPNAHIL